MNLSTDEIEASQNGEALLADYSASPYYLTELSDNICDISILVCNYCEKPTKGQKTRKKFLKSLVSILAEANEQLTLYIEDLKQAKCIEPFSVSSDQDDDDKFWKLIDKLCKEIQHEEAYQCLKDNIIRFRSLLAEAENTKQNCNPIVFKKFFFRKKKDYSDESVVKRFNRQLYKNKPITFDKLRELQVDAVMKALNQGIFDYAKKPSRQDVNKVSPELTSDILPCDFEITEEFKKTYAKFRQFTEKKGPMLVFNYEVYGQYILDNSDELSDEQLQAIFELDVMLKLIHKEMVRLDPELAKYLNQDDDDPNTFGIMNSLTRLMQQDWFKEFRTDKNYDDAWIEKFVADLLASEHRQELLDIWQVAKKRLTLKGNIIGCLKMAGVIDGSDLGIATALLKGSEGENTKFAIYMGRGKKMAFGDWICEYVKR